MKLEAKGISFRYAAGRREILHHVNLAVAEGERVGLIAPSGTGKTTLCKIMAGYERAEQGQVLLDGKPLHTFRGHCPVQMVWQHPELVLNPRLRMREALREGSPVEERIVHGLGIEPGWLDRFPAELSGGELQRFCIARALGPGTRFLLADEITTMLDLITQSQIWAFLTEEVERRNMGLLAVSHSQPLLDWVCQRVEVLEAYQ